IAERLHGRRIERLRALLSQRQVHGELGHDRLARARGSGHEHAAARLERAAALELEVVEVDRQPGTKALELRSAGSRLRRRVAFGRREHHVVGCCHALVRLASTASRRRSTARSCERATPTARKYSSTIGSASSSIEIGSAAGVAIAVKTMMMSTAQRQPLRIVFPCRTLAKFSSTRNTGITNATPVASSSLRMKST